MTSLVIFDIDGTLVNSTEIDAECYVKSIQKEFGIDDIDERWETYENVTDAGIFDEIFVRANGRKPSGSEIDRQIKRFMALLREYHSANPSLLEEIGGAGDIIDRLKNDKNWMVGIATGAWRESALFKLASASLNFTGIPLATSSDRLSRKDILEKCIGDSKRVYKANEFDKIISVGDGVWDLWAAKELGLGFIGILSSGKNDIFEDSPAVNNYLDQTEFFKCLEKAKIPK